MAKYCFCIDFYSHRFDNVPFIWINIEQLFDLWQFFSEKNKEMTYLCPYGQNLSSSIDEIIVQIIKFGQ